MILKAKAATRVGSDKTLGTATISIADEPIDTYIEKTVPLNASDAITVALFKSLRSPSKPIDSKHFERLPRLRIQLERSSYFPGEEIRGLLWYSAIKPVEIQSLRVEIEGMERVACVTSSDSKDLKSSGSGASTIAAVAPLFRKTAIIFGGEEENNADKKVSHVLQPGAPLQIFFSFTLPEFLPPSASAVAPASPVSPPSPSTSKTQLLERPTANIAYSIYACAEVIASAKEIHIIPERMDFQVLAHPKHIRNDMLLLHVEPSSIDQRKKTKVTLDVSSLPATVITGEEFEFDICFDNTKGAKPINLITLDLVCIWKIKCIHPKEEVKGPVRTSVCQVKIDKSYKSPSSASPRTPRPYLGHTTIINDNDEYGETCTRLPIGIGNKFQTTVKMSVPANACPTIPAAMSPLFQAKYMIVAKIQGGDKMTSEAVNAEFGLTVFNKSPVEPIPSPFPPSQFIIFNSQDYTITSPLLIPGDAYSSTKWRTLASDRSGSEQWKAIGPISEFSGAIIPIQHDDRDKVLHVANPTEIPSGQWEFGKIANWLSPDDLGLPLALLPTPMELETENHPFDGY